MEKDNISFTNSINNIQIKNQFSNESLSVQILWVIYNTEYEIFIKNIIEIYNNDLEKSIEELKKLLLNVEWLFILIIKDFVNKKTIIINDKMWLKAFYIYKQWKYLSYNEDFLELIKAINKKEVNNEAIFEVLSLWYTTRWKTIIKHVCNLKPWTINIVENNKIKSLFYYKLKKRKNVVIDDIYNSFLCWLEIRTSNLENINCALTWWYDTRFIVWNLVKLYWNKKINCYTENIDKKDLEISQIVAKKLWINHSINEIGKEEVSILKQIESKLNQSKNNNFSFVSWICGGEILWNALWKSWFTADNIEWFINKTYKYNKEEEKIIKWMNKYNYWIKTFVENILRTNLNAVEWVGWVNPSSYFYWNVISPFCDSDFVTNIYSKNVDQIKNYNIYTKLYEKYFPELLDINYTYNNEREKKAIDFKNNFVSKNYIISEKEYKTLVYIWLKLAKESSIFKNMINIDIVYKKPLEVVVILIQLKKLRLN